MNILRCKAAIIGDPRVGKTCLINQLIKNYFNNTYQTTLGIDYNTYDAKLKESTVQFHIMDFTGFSVFRDLIYSQIKDVNFIIYVYDVTNQESFASVKLWKDSFKEYLKGKNVIEVLVANKVDLVNHYFISKIDKDYIFYEVIFNGTTTKFINLMKDQNYNFDTQRKVWILE